MSFVIGAAKTAFSREMLCGYVICDEAGVTSQIWVSSHAAAGNLSHKTSLRRAENSWLDRWLPRHLANVA